MKIAFFSESVADEAALKILVSGILNEKIEETDLPNRLEYRSSSHLDRDLPAVISAVYYNSNADALIVVSDSDDTPVHTKEHEMIRNERCRLCRLRKAVDEKIVRLRPIAGKKIVKVAIGVPVPAIEAWYLFGKRLSLSENIWIRRQNGENIQYDRMRLKEKTRPSIDLETKIAETEANRIVESNLFDELEKSFPHGFGTFANEVRSWKR